MHDSDAGLVLDDLYIDKDWSVDHDLLEEDDYIITEDPLLPDDEEAWAVVILQGDYKDWVVRFPDVLLDNGELEYTYEVLYMPEEAQDKEWVDVSLANYMTSLLTRILDELHKTEGQVYVDPKTGEQVEL